MEKVEDRTWVTKQWHLVDVAVEWSEISDDDRRKVCGNIRSILIPNLWNVF